MGLFGKKEASHNGLLNKIANPNPNGQGLFGRIANPGLGGGGLFGRLFNRAPKNTNTQPTNFEEPPTKPNNGSGSSW